MSFGSTKISNKVEIAPPAPPVITIESGSVSIPRKFDNLSEIKFLKSR